MTPDEVRMLDNRYALLFIRGERPILDEKIDILSHPNVALTTDGKGKPYRHGEVTGNATFAPETSSTYSSARSLEEIDNRKSTR